MLRMLKDQNDAKAWNRTWHDKGGKVCKRCKCAMHEGPKPLLAQKKEAIFCPFFSWTPSLPKPYPSLVSPAQPNLSHFGIGWNQCIVSRLMLFIFSIYVYMFVFVYVSMNLLNVMCIFTNINFNSTYFISLNIS